MTVFSFYNKLVTSSSPLRPEMQHEIYGYATRRKKTGLLTDLLRREDLVGELEDEMRESNDLAVLSGWAMRPNRTPEQLQERLLREKRVTALVPLASMENLPETVYRTIAAVTSAKLAEILAGNPSVPLDVRIDKVVEFASRPSRRSYGTRELINNLCRGEEEMYRAVARTTRVGGYLQACIESGCLKAADIDAVVSRLSSVANDEGYHGTGEFNGLLGAFASVPLSAAQAAAITKSCEAYIERVSKHSHAQWTMRSIQENLAKIQRRQGALSEKLKELAAATDTDGFLALFTEASELVKDPDDAELLAEAVVAHDLAPTELLVKHFDRGGRYGRSDATGLIVRRLDARGALDELAEALSHSSYGHDVDALANATEIVRKTIAVLRSRHAPVPYWIRQSKVVAANPDLAVEILPWEALVDLLGSHRADEISGLVQQRLLDAFGDDRHLWETFETLTTQYEGTFPELLDTVAKLS